MPVEICMKKWCNLNCRCRWWQNCKMIRWDIVIGNIWWRKRVIISAPSQRNFDYPICLPWICINIRWEWAIKTHFDALTGNYFKYPSICKCFQHGIYAKGQNDTNFHTEILILIEMTGGCGGNCTRGKQWSSNWANTWWTHFEMGSINVYISATFQANAQTRLYTPAHG